MAVIAQHITIGPEGAYAGALALASPVRGRTSIVALTPRAPNV